MRTCVPLFKFHMLTFSRLEVITQDPEASYTTLELLLITPNDLENSYFRYAFTMLSCCGVPARTRSQITCYNSSYGLYGLAAMLLAIFLGASLRICSGPWPCCRYVPGRPSHIGR
jgi:hypothetical protein